MPRMLHRKTEFLYSWHNKGHHRLSDILSFSILSVTLCDGHVNYQKVKKVLGNKCETYSRDQNWESAIHKAHSKHKIFFP